MSARGCLNVPRDVTREVAAWCGKAACVGAADMMKQDERRGRKHDSLMGKQPRRGARVCVLRSEEGHKAGREGAESQGARKDLAA